MLCISSRVVLLVVLLQLLEGSGKAAEAAGGVSCRQPDHVVPGEAELQSAREVRDKLRVELRRAVRAAPPPQEPPRWRRDLDGGGVSKLYRRKLVRVSSAQERARWKERRDQENARRGIGLGGMWVTRSYEEVYMDKMLDILARYEAAVGPV